MEANYRIDCSERKKNLFSGGKITKKRVFKI